MAEALHTTDNHPTQELMNPLIDLNGFKGQTAHNVSCVLEYLQSMDHDRETTNAENDDWRYGRHMLYNVMIHALRNESARAEAEAACKEKQEAQS